MARPKAKDMKELAERAQADLDAVDGKGLAVRLKTVQAAAKCPLAVVAEVMGITVQSAVRWIGLYREGGLDALRPKPRRPKASKLDAAQKAAVLSWLGAGRNAAGEEVNWTLDGVRAAIADEFGVSLARNSIWVWLRKEGWMQKAARPLTVRNRERPALTVRNRERPVMRRRTDSEAQEDFKKKRRG